MSAYSSDFMKRACLLVILSWAGAICIDADNTTLNSSYPPSSDSVTYHITINSAANPPSGPQVVASGVYHLHFGGFGDPEITVLSNGTIENDGYYGMPATISNDGLSITFTSSYTNNAWEFRDTYDDYDPPYPWHDFSQPPFEFYNDTQSWTFYAEGPIPHPPTPNQFWSVPVTVDDYFYHNWVAYGVGVVGLKIFYTAIEDGSGTATVRPPLNKVVNYSVSLPGPDGKPHKVEQSPPDSCSGTCTSCSTSPKMATYSFDRLRGSLRVTDTPLLYSPPVGPGISFTVTYNQGDVGQQALPFLSNVGSQFTYNFLSYISNLPNTGNVTRFVPGGGLEYYPTFNVTPGDLDLAATQDAVSDPERSTRAVLYWDAANQRYTRMLPDGSSQVYSQPSTDLNGVPIFLVTSETDPRGNTISYGYDSQGRLTTITDAIGQVTTLSYGNGDQYKITKVTDPFGRSARFQYDSQGRLTSSTDALGIVSNYGYDSTNFLNSLRTPYGITTFTTDSDVQHHGINATNPLGQTERVELRYNSVPAISDTDTVPTATGIQAASSGLSSGNTYYWTRRQYSTTPDYTKATVIHWMSGPRGLTNIVDSLKKPLEGRVWYNYQGQSQADYIADGASALPTITARLLDGGATQASYASYNNNGLVTQSIDPVGRTTNYTYDSTNNIDLLQVAQTNGSGQDVLSTMTYDSQHDPLTVTDASGQTTTMTYNAAGQMLTRTDAKSETTTMAYDSHGYLESVTGPVSGATTSYTYDSAGRVHTITDSEGYVLTMTYDASDRPTLTTYPDGTTDQTVYKNLDVDHTIDRQGRVTSYQYDPIRELLQTTDPLGRTTKYTWCTCGGLSTLTDANGNVTTWNLDIMGRVTGKVYADSSQITYTYESSTSRLHGMTDAVGNSSVYSYNLDNTLNGTTYTPASGVAATPNVSFTYDPVYNRVTGMTDGTGTTSYSYNAIPANAATSPTTGAGRLAGVIVPIAGSTATIAYGYDELGRVTSRSVDGSTTNQNNVSTSFDTLGRVTGVTNALGAFTYWYVDQTSRLSSVIYPTGTSLSTSYAYYNNVGDQRLQTIQNLQGTTQLSRFDYTYNPVGTIATWTQQADSSTAIVNTLSYDDADQLTSAAQSGGGSASNGYNYDPAGNRLAETTGSGTTAGQFNNLNQLTSLSTSTTSQTVAGTTSANATVNINAVAASITNGTNFVANVALPSGTNVVSVVAQPSSTGTITATKRYQIVTSGTHGTSLTYDANGNTLTDENGNSYQWDALNRLTKITYPSGASSLFAYDGLSRRVQIVEKNASGAITSTKNYLWIGQEMAEERDASNTVTKRFFPQGEQQAGVNYYYTKDHLGSTREMCSSTGAIVARYSYDPYGRTTLVSGSNLATFQYTGDFYHATSGLYLTKYRAYDPNTGRWLSRDPVAESGGLNLYRYCGDEPIDFDDPLGLKKCWKLMLITQYKDKNGDHPRPGHPEDKANGLPLGPGDAASGVPGYKPSDFDKKGNLIGPAKKGKGVYPDGTQFTIYHQNGTVAHVTINDTGAGYAEPRPKSGVPGGTSPDDWLDEWHKPDNGDPEWDWVSQEVPDNCPCPKGWKG